MDIAKALGLSLQITAFLFHHLVVLEFLHGLLLLLMLVVILVLVVGDLLWVHFRTVSDTKFINHWPPSIIGNQVAIRNTRTTLNERRQASLISTWHAWLVLLLEQSLLIIASIRAILLRLFVGRHVASLRWELL